MNRALLRLASVLVPAHERAEWLEEWRAELAYVPPKQATRFCLGAFRDACWVRRHTDVRQAHLQSPGACLAVLTAAACLSLFLAFWLPLPRTIFFPRSPGLATISGISVEEYRQLPREHGDFAFYLRLGPASRNFRAVAGADAARFLPGPFTRFDLVDDQSFPPDSIGYVVARTDRFTERIGRFRLVPVGEPHPWVSFLLVLAMCLAVLPAVTEISLGKCPANARFRLFLAAKFVLILPIVVLGSVDVFSLIALGLQPHAVLVGGVIGMRWVLVDQRRRCPVCLRLLSHPTSIGAPSRTLLEWYGTELMCDKGHGLMHVPEIRNSYSEPRWMRLDSSWSGLFCNPSEPRSIV